MSSNFDEEKLVLASVLLQKEMKSYTRVAASERLTL